MKKQKFEVGEKICAYRGYDRCVGFVEKIYKNSDVLKLKRYDYYFNFKQCRRLVKKKKPVEVPKFGRPEDSVNVEPAPKSFEELNKRMNDKADADDLKNSAQRKEGLTMSGKKFTYPANYDGPPFMVDDRDFNYSVVKRAARECWIFYNNAGEPSAMSWLSPTG